MMPSKEFEKLEELIKSGDCPGLLKLLESSRYLAVFCEQNQSGDSLKKSFQDSGQVNKKYPYQIYNYHASSKENPTLSATQINQCGAISEQLILTPLQYIFEAPQYNSEPTLNFVQLRLLLTLGVNVNEPIDEDENTVLHEYLAKNPNLLALKKLINAGGDVNKKNKHGVSPLDKADEYTRKYLQNFFAKKDRQLQATITIQRQWRKKMASKKTIENQNPVEINHPFLSNPAKGPEADNPPDQEKMQLWIDKHQEKDRGTAKKVVNSIHHVSFGHFLFGLKYATKKFNQYLLSLPAHERKYVLMIDARKEKSGGWTTNLAQRFLATPPSDIVLDNKLKQFKPGPDVQHIVIFDDASYSGNFFISFMEQYFERVEYNHHLMNLQLHLVIPFVTEKALWRFEKHNVVVHSQETMDEFKISGTKFVGPTATYFSHKIACDESTIECIENGKLITGEESDITFVKPVIPPYKK